MIDWIKKHNIVIWVLSFILAVMFWLYVDITQDAERDKTLNIHPTFYGEDILLNEKDVVVTSRLEDIVLNIRVHGKASDLVLCTNTSVQINIQLNKISVSDTGDQKVYYNIDNIVFPDQVGQRVNLVSQDAPYFTVTTDKIESKIFDVQVNRGNIQIPEGYKLESTLSDPAQIKVYGPSEQLRKVAGVQVSPEKEGLNQTARFIAAVTLVDNDGAEVISNELTCSQKEVEVTLVISMVKSVDLTVDLLEGGGVKAENVQLTISPASTLLSGDPAVLETLNVITLGSIDLAGINDGFSKPFHIPTPNGVESSAGPDATVTVNFIGIATKRFDVSNITLIGAAPEVSLVSLSVPVTLRGPEASINAVTPYDIRVVVDLTNVELAKGQQNVSVTVNVDGFPDVGALGEPKATVELAEVTTPEETP